MLLEMLKLTVNKLAVTKNLNPVQGLNLHIVDDVVFLLLYITISFSLLLYIVGSSISGTNFSSNTNGEGDPRTFLGEPLNHQNIIAYTFTSITVEDSQ